MKTIYEEGKDGLEDLIEGEYDDDEPESGALYDKDLFAAELGEDGEDDVEFD